MVACALKIGFILFPIEMLPKSIRKRILNRRKEENEEEQRKKEERGRGRKMIHVLLSLPANLAGVDNKPL